METIKTLTLSPEQVAQLAKLAKAYKEEQAKESVHKKNKEAIGKTIKEFFGEQFDGNITIETDDYTGTITYKYVISFVADKEKIIEQGLYNELYKPSQAHKLTVG